MFSSLRSRLWLSYAFLIITALVVVAIVLVFFLLRNPIIYRQTFLRLNAAEQAMSIQDHPIESLDTIAKSFNVRIILFGNNGALLKDSDLEAPALALPISPIIPKALPTVRDFTGKLWFYSVERLSDGTWLMVTAPRPKIVPILTVLTDDISAPSGRGWINCTPFIPCFGLGNCSMDR